MIPLKIKLLVEAEIFMAHICIGQIIYYIGIKLESLHDSIYLWNSDI